MTTIRVAGPAPYDVHVGHGVRDRLAGLLDGAQRVAVVHAPGLGVDLDGPEVLDIELPDGEAAKSAAVVADAWERLGAAGFTRSDAVVTVGGGATTDVGVGVAGGHAPGVGQQGADGRLAGAHGPDEHHGHLNLSVSR